MTRVKGGTVSKNILEVNIDFIKQHKNKFSIVENMLIVIEEPIKETLENFGLQELMLDVVKMISAIQNLLMGLILQELK